MVTKLFCYSSLRSGHKKRANCPGKWNKYHSILKIKIYFTASTLKFSKVTGKLFLPGAAATTPICTLTPGGK